MPSLSRKAARADTAFQMTVKRKSPDVVHDVSRQGRACTHAVASCASVGGRSGQDTFRGLFDNWGGPLTGSVTQCTSRGVFFGKLCKEQTPTAVTTLGR